MQNDLVLQVFVQRPKEVRVEVRLFSISLPLVSMLSSFNI